MSGRRDGMWKGLEAGNNFPSEEASEGLGLALEATPTLGISLFESLLSAAPETMGKALY